MVAGWSQRLTTVFYTGKVGFADELPHSPNVACNFSVGTEAHYDIADTADCPWASLVGTPSPVLIDADDTVVLRQDQPGLVMKVAVTGGRTIIPLQIAYSLTFEQSLYSTSDFTQDEDWQTWPEGEPPPPPIEFPPPGKGEGPGEWGDGEGPVPPEEHPDGGAYLRRRFVGSDALRRLGSRTATYTTEYTVGTKVTEAMWNALPANGVVEGFYVAAQTQATTVDVETPWATLTPCEPVGTIDCAGGSAALYIQDVVEAAAPTDCD